MSKPMGTSMDGPEKEPEPADQREVLVRMQAVRLSGFGGRDQLSVGEVALPKPLGKNDVLVKVMAVSINAGDHHMLTGRPYIIRVAVGLREIPGMDFSGVVEAVGSGVGLFAPGEEVVGTADVACGAFAEFVSVPSNFVVKKPKDVDWEAAAALPTAGQTALQALRLGGAPAAGDSVLINGASGGVGSFAVQIAHHLGAHVTAVCSTKNVDLVRSLGADVVVDYSKGSIDMIVAGTKYDKIIDCVGRPGWRPLLKAKGAVIAVALPYPDSECVPCALCSVLCSPWCCCCLSSRKAHPFMQEVKVPDLEELVAMMSEGKLRAVIGRKFSGLSALPDALAGKAIHGGVAGKIVVRLHGDGSPPGEMQRE